jgi:ribosome-binding ATPase YchF (GTP1/OBG family)
MFLEEYQIQQSGLDKITKTTFSMLGLATFLTGGPEESRAWTFKVGYKAPQCAGVIHSDFEKGFIKAAIYTYEELLRYGSESAVKEAGKIRLEGKEYIMKDGDIVHFRFNI